LKYVGWPYFVAILVHDQQPSEECLLHDTRITIYQAHPSLNTLDTLAGSLERSSPIRGFRSSMESGRELAGLAYTNRCKCPGHLLDSPIVCQMLSCQGQAEEVCIDSVRAQTCHDRIRSRQKWKTIFGYPLTRQHLPPEVNYDLSGSPVGLNRGFHDCMRSRERFWVHDLRLRSFPSGVGGSITSFSQLSFRRHLILLLLWLCKLLSLALL
jgi:hypothetical protein